MEYEVNDVTCPLCGSSNIDFNYFENFKKPTIIDCSCLDCEHAWQALY